MRIGWEKEKGEITLDQEEYVNDVLATWGMENARGVPSPADQESWREPEKEDLTEEERKEAVAKAQQVLGSLLWASTRTRPDISFAVGKAASMVSKRPVEAVQRGQRILRYLAGTRSVGLKYQIPKHSEIVIEVGSDASFGGEGLKGTSGLTIRYRGQLINWRSNRQTLAATSTFESEIQALSSAVSAGLAVKETLQ